MPIVRGKAAAPVEFGAKPDLSIDENGIARREKMSFDAYNESGVLMGAIERCCGCIGHYPERALADKIYRNCGNLAFCKLHGIRRPGPSLGHPKKDVNFWWCCFQGTISGIFCCLSLKIIVWKYQWLNEQKLT